MNQVIFEILKAAFDGLTIVFFLIVFAVFRKMKRRFNNHSTRLFVLDGRQEEPFEN